MKNNTYIIEAKRTPVGKFSGSFTSISATELASVVIRNIITANPKIKNKIQEVILGNVLSAGLGQNPARIASIKAGLSRNIPAFTVNKVCGSGLKSIALASQSIEAEEADLIIAGGMENMSRSPYLLNNLRFGIKLGNQNLIDSMINDGLFCSLIGEHMGITAENIARRYKISRKQQDEYSLKSHQKAIKAILNKKLTDEIVPIEISEKGKTLNISIDEQPRKDTTLEALSKLKPVFKKDGTVTAGNSSSLNDGAAAVLLASKQFIDKERLKPLAVIRSYASIALDPKFMGMGSYFAAVKCLKKASIDKSQVDLWEINEAFASQILAVLKLLGISDDKVNVNGGAIAFGHPIGASGTRLAVSLIHELKRRKLKYGVVSLCIGGGQGIAMLIENTCL